MWSFGPIASERGAAVQLQKLWSCYGHYTIASEPGTLKLQIRARHCSCKNCGHVMVTRP